MKTQDVLADQMGPHGPLLNETVRVVGEAGGGDVVDEGVEPHVGDLAVVPRERNTPTERRSRHRDVFEALLNETNYLVASRVGVMNSGFAAMYSSSRSP